MSLPLLQASTVTFRMCRYNGGNRKTINSAAAAVITSLSGACRPYMALRLSDLCWAVLLIKAAADEYYEIGCHDKNVDIGLLKL
jgi:hypothetical protein